MKNLMLGILSCSRFKLRSVPDYFFRGLKGEGIPLEARIFAVIDVYDALTSDRPYPKAWSKEETLEYIREQSGKHFDPQVVEVFLKLEIDG